MDQALLNESDDKQNQKSRKNSRFEAIESAARSPSITSRNSQVKPIESHYGLTFPEQIRTTNIYLLTGITMFGIGCLIFAVLLSDSSWRGIVPYIIAGAILLVVLYRWYQLYTKKIQLSYDCSCQT
eukprot:c9673_g1_i1.p1 GENE.c9673_g1_i1~~c9673_g1_i1.p1  ORF type:complete len:134 (-),score=36.19 c9673_g1_i1:31-408(-)